MDDDPTTLDVVKDSSDRAFLFTYQDIAGSSRIVELKGYDPDSPNHDLLGLDIQYHYDEPPTNPAVGPAASFPLGNLTSVTRLSPTGNSSDTRTEIYQYTQGAGAGFNQLSSAALLHNLRFYTDPNGNSTEYVYYPDDSRPTGDMPSPGLNPADAAFFGVPSVERVMEVREPGGATSASASSSPAVTKFTYNFSITPGGSNTRVVTDARPGVPATTYTLDDYGATIRVDGPDGQTTRYRVGLRSPRSERRAIAWRGGCRAVVHHGLVGAHAFSRSRGRS